ncbi:MAG: hypothetical protein HC880_05005 [Bacteroidia bacterium]|nr:hypothetical protein [Bacteroidia bacterium]
MTRTFTLHDLIRYLYNETSAEENQVIAVLIATDAEFQEKYQEFAEMKHKINLLAKNPSDRVIQKILDFSREYDLHSV